MKQQTINQMFINAINSKREQSYSAIYEYQGSFYRTPAYSYSVLQDYIEELKQTGRIENLKIVAEPY